MVHSGVVRHFEVERLFGRYNYSLNFGDSPDKVASQVSLLYGDNGTGKTTILKLMYHLLSKASGEGNRTFLSRTPLVRACVELWSGERIEYTKDERQLLTFFDRHSRSETVELFPDVDLAITSQNNPEVRRYEAFLATLKIEQLYLSDDRVILSSYPRFSRRQRNKPGVQRIIGPHGDVEAIVQSPSPALDNVDLNALGTRVRDIIREKLIDSSAFGQSNVNNIYLDLAKRLSRPDEASFPHRPQTIEALENRAAKIKTAYETASSLEIFPAANFDEFISVARNAGASRLSTIEVINTFLDTVEAQVQAVSSLAVLLNGLIDEVNSYLVNKRLTFSIKEGFRIISDAKRLKFSELSSGERQLIFLMLLSIAIRDDRSIVYIDEPELSLNIKWQRKLVSSIFKMIKETETQIIAATHSFEMLAKHSNSMIDLNKMS